MRNLIIALGLSLFATFVARDAHTQNLPPLIPYEPYPEAGATKQSVVGWLAWESGDDEWGLVFDVYFGQTPDPPLQAINIPVNPWNKTSASWDPPGIQLYSWTYYWRIVARDKWGVETAGPTWSYTTKALNEPPLTPLAVSPDDGATGNPINVTLKYYTQDFEGGGCYVDIYFGTDPNPPLVAEHLTGEPQYQPGLLQPSTLYYWRIVARDVGGLETSGPVWSFATANTTNQIPAAPSNPRPASWATFAPTQLLKWDSHDPDGDELTFNVYLSPRYPSDRYPLPLVGTTQEDSLLVGPLSDYTRYYWCVEVKDADWTVKGPLWHFDNGNVPVLFSQFDARIVDDDVEVRWSLASDEAMESYTIYRREDGTGSSVAITSAAAVGGNGSYLDTTVEPAKKYHYEMVVHTADGDVFRSPIATVSTPAVRLVLHQNVPNPFNPQTTIRYELPAPAFVRLTIVDVAGRRVRTLVDGQEPAGSRETIWNGRNDGGSAVSSGVYFYVLDAGKQRLTRKLVLLK